MRKSTRAKKDEREEENNTADVLPPSLDASSSCRDSQQEVQETETEVEAAKAECVEQGEEEKEGWSRANNKGTELKDRWTEATSSFTIDTELRVWTNESSSCRKIFPK